MGFLASLIGCGKEPPSPPPAPPANKFMIDYAHESEGVFCHGTFTLIGGKVRATWTVDGGGNKRSQNVNMTEEAFRGVWDSLNEIGDFKAGAVKDPQQALDPKTHHVVGIAFSLGGQMTTRTHMIPATSASPAFQDWLSSLGYPGK